LKKHKQKYPYLKTKRPKCPT